MKTGGVDARQLEAKGYGVEKPVAPNTTADNLAKNRRTIFGSAGDDGEAIERRETGNGLSRLSARMVAARSFVIGLVIGWFSCERVDNEKA